MNDLHAMAQAARAAALVLVSTTCEERNAALLAIRRSLLAHKQAIFEANLTDLRNAEAEQLAAPLLHRLTFGQEKLDQVCAGLDSLINLPDPLGETTLSRELVEGLDLYRVTCPIGVIGIVFESRPDALVQISSLALKSGNAVLLKGGREAILTNTVLCEAIREGVAAAGLPASFAQLLTTREDVSAMLKEDTLIDLIIPRGSKAFVRYIMDNSRIPVLGHSDGLCHVYVDKDADLDMAVRVAVDSKAQNVSVCNAMETLLVHRDVASAFLPELAAAMKEKGIALVGDEITSSIIGCEAATTDDWRTEYLDYKLSIKTVTSLDDAIEHINRYGSHHTDCIVTENAAAAAEFMKRVDSAGVYQNVSTRFADGFAYGFGAEVGIATGKLHARGPMGLEGLTTYKYKLLGHGQTMADIKGGKLHYTHHLLNQKCPMD